MILSSATATDLTLTSFTRTLLGDPVGSPLPQFADADITNSLNISYIEGYKIARRLDAGWGHKTAYEDSVADQILYDLPADLDGRIIDVALETNGKDFDTDSAAVWTYLTPKESNVALKGYRMQQFVLPQYVFKQGTKYGIVAPPANSGTNSIHLLYEGELDVTPSTGDLLESAADEPSFIPESDHPLLCYLAAITLRLSKSLPVEDIRTEAARKYPLFIEQAQETFLDLDAQIPCAGKERYTIFANKTGFLVRR